MNKPFVEGTVRTLHRWTEDWSQLPERRVSLMEWTAKSPWSRRAFNLEDIGSGLILKRNGAHLSMIHNTKWILSRLSTQIRSARLRGNTTTTPSYGTDYDDDDDFYWNSLDTSTENKQRHERINALMLHALGMPWFLISTKCTGFVLVNQDGL